MGMIPEGLKVRLQKLMALAADTRGNENEAAAASAKVQALLGQYNLEMSQVVETGAEEVDPDSERAKSEAFAETTERWQVDLMAGIARNNFCLHWTNNRFDDRNELIGHSHYMIGRKINLDTSRRMYEYLTATMDRLNPFTDKRKVKSRRSWNEGCANRLDDRLYKQRQESEAASRAERNEGPRGNGSDLVLADVYSSEEDLNRDLRWGYAPGTTARNRRENETRWAAEAAERAANPPVPEPVREETERQRDVRRRREAAEYEKMKRRWARMDAKEAKRVDRDAYAMGANTGNQIGLNEQLR
jgi:hypothetical protein